VVEFK
jgi:hypothetical protein